VTDVRPAAAADDLECGQIAAKGDVALGEIVWIA